MSEADKEEVQILGVEAQMFEVLLEFIYTASSCHEMYHFTECVVYSSVHTQNST